MVMKKARARGVRALLYGGGLAASLLVAGNASASLIYLGQQNLTGTGLGSVPTILTLNGNPAASGSVGRSGGADVETGNIQASQTQTIRVGDLTGLDLGSELRLVFNGNEPQGGGQ